MRMLVAPDPSLRACVVVPARNEEDLVGQCIQALASQSFVSPAEYEVILILDGCTDETESRAREAALKAPDLRLHFLDGPGEGAGHARRVGMEAACSRLLDIGRETGLIASTDADTVVDPDWLAAQFECLDQGARAIGGRIELSDDAGLPKGVAGWRSERGSRRHMDLLSESSSSGESPGFLEHWQFSGASLSLTAEVYREIGGLEPHAALEDEHLERILCQRGIAIERPISVRVTTSARLVGRAERGLAKDLALASWFETNTYEVCGLDAEDSAVGKKHRISAVVIADADDEGLRRSVDSLLADQRSGLLDEAMVVFTGDRINGLPAGITVLEAEDLLPEFGPVRGYGDALWRSVSVAEGEIVVFLEPGVDSSSLKSLLGALIRHEEMMLVKGFGPSTGHLSELVARPLINLHRPELAGFVDPLSRTLAARRSLLENLSFPVGEGASLSLLLDTAEIFGTDALAQVRLGAGHPCGTPSPPTPEAAYALQAAATSRTSQKTLAPGPLFLPSHEAGLQTRRVPTEERPPLASLDLPAYAVEARGWVELG